MLLILIILLEANVALWTYPGVTRPFPGPTIVISGLVMLIAGGAIFRFRPSDRSRPTFLIGYLLLVWLGISSQTSIDGFRSSQALAAWIGAIGTFLLTSMSTTSNRRWLSLVSGLCLSATVIVCYGTATAPQGSFLAATFSNADTFSVVCLIGFFLALSLSQNEDYRIRVFSMSQQLILGFGIIRTGSRAGVLGLAFGLLSIFLASRIRKNEDQRLGDASQALRLPALLALVAIITGLASPLLGRISEFQSGKDYQGVAMRWGVLVGGLKATTVHPILGSGPGTFSLLYQQFRPSGAVPDYIYVNVAHNDFVETAVETGWVGFALLAVFCVLVSLRALRIIKHKTFRWEATSLIGGLAGLGVFSLLNFAISVPALLIWESILLGLIQGLPAGRAATKQENLSLRILYCVLALITGAWAVWFGMQATRANSSLTRAEVYIKALRWEEALPILDQATEFQPGNATLYLLRGQLKARLGKFKTKAGSQNSAETDLNRAGDLSKRDIRIARARINYYQVMGNYGKAEELTIQLHMEAPYLTGLVRQICSLQLLQGKTEEAALTLYSSSLEQAETGKMLVPILSDLEEKAPGAAVSLLGGWSQNEGAAQYSVNLSRLTARECYTKGKYQAARRLLESLSRQDPADLETLYLTALVEKRMGNKTGLAKTLQKIISTSDPNLRQQPYVELSIAQWALIQPDFGKKGPTLDYLERGLRRFPRSRTLRMLISEVHLRDNDPDPAAEVISKGLDFYPDDPLLLARLGTCLSKQGLRDLALGYFDQALKLDPTIKEARAGRLGKPLDWTRIHNGPIFELPKPEL